MELKAKDEVLIDKFLSGDEQGFTMLVKKHQERVVNIVHSLSIKTQDAEDIAQEVFMRVYRGLAAFKKKAEFATWLYRIAVNTAYNYLKRERRYRPLEQLPAGEIAQKDSLESPEYRERQQLINMALDKLPFKLRTVVALKDIEGLSYKDIAQTLGCRIGTVESRLFRARRMLKRLLSPILKAEAGNELR